MQRKKKDGERATHRSFQKLRSSSMVLAAPRMRAKRTSTPPSPTPQKALQKSRLRAEVSGEVVRAYFASDVVEGCRRADMMRTWYLCGRRGWSKMQQKKYTAVLGLNTSPGGRILAVEEWRRRGWRGPALMAVSLTDLLTATSHV